MITCFPNYPIGRVYDGYKNSFRKTETIDGIKVIRVWTYITSNSGFLKRVIDYMSFSVTSFLAGLFCKCDIIVATSPQFFTALSGRTLHFFKRKPWIMEVRDLWPESIKTVGAMNDGIVLRYFSKEEKWCYRSAEKIVVVTDSFKREISAMGIDAGKIHVVKNGVNTECFRPRPKSPELLRELGLEGKRILGYIGTLGMAHKLDFLLDCIKGLDNYSLLIMGEGAEKENIRRKISDEGITNVVLLDSVPKNKVADYVALQDAALINLRRDPLFTTVIPSKIFETAAMNVPIMLGVDGEARTLVEHYGAGIFYKPEDKADFLEKLELLFSSDDLYNACRNGGARLAIDYNRKNLAHKMLDILVDK